MSWDKYFLKIATVVASRSKDPHTKCGCVIANPLNEIISTGFNGPVRRCNDLLIPNTRPEKYFHYIHSEVNCILSAKSSLVDCTAFVSARPCLNCTQLLYHVGIRKIVYTDWSKPSSAHYPEDKFKIFMDAITESLILNYISWSDICD